MQGKIRLYRFSIMDYGLNKPNRIKYSLGKPTSPQNAIQGKKNKSLLNPATNTENFGFIPNTNIRGEIIEAGRIILRIGIHTGFGANHIWHRHSTDLQYLIDLGLSPADAVIQYVSKIIQPKTPIYCEFESIRGEHRTTVVHSSAGTAVLEPVRLGDGERVYSVVTAYQKKKPSGTKVGIVEPWLEK